MKGFLLGVVTTIAVLIAVVFGYFASGRAPVATSAPPMPFEGQFAHMALHARMEKEMPKQSPVAADEPNLTGGARVYMEHCAVCHGVPGKEQTAIAKGEFPRPPHLFQGKGVTDDEPGETYWKVANGIRLTGMPGFDQHLSTTEMWQVSLLLANADKITDPVKAVLAGSNNAAPEATGAKTPGNLSK
ncbi:MAG TPA: cytochrome c [Terriglobales bacterium]|jgi:mono/diheme cytochrome c family protein|nr:cytochrome c [Terriglobales bacterium]